MPPSFISTSGARAATFPISVTCCRSPCWSSRPTAAKHRSSQHCCTTPQKTRAALKPWLTSSRASAHPSPPSSANAATLSRRPSLRGGFARQRYVVAHLAEVSADTILVSLADKLDNSRAILRAISATRGRRCGIGSVRAIPRITCGTTETLLRSSDSH